MTVLKEYRRLVSAIQIGDDLDAACAAINKSKVSGDHCWNNGAAVIISHSDGIFEDVPSGHWVVIGRDGSLEVVSGDVFTTQYTELASKIAG
jgi:hypothetical protein